MEYTDLAQAIRENNAVKVNEYLTTLIPRLQRFLVIHMNASRADAEDCAQETLLNTLEVVKEEKLHNPERILSYLLTSCRNNYLKMQNKRHEQPYDELPHTGHTRPGQLKSLLDAERLELLESCMEELKEDYRAFMEYWFDHPDADADEVAGHFDISVNNAWTRKHRIIKQLNECYEKKSSR